MEGIAKKMKAPGSLKMESKKFKTAMKEIF